VSQYPTAGFCFSDRAQLFLSDRPCMFSPEAIARLLKSNYFSFASNTILYRRDALSAIGGFNEDLRWYADWFADYVMAFRHGACYVPEVLAIYRVSPGSYSARGVRQSETQRELIYRILDALASNPWQDVARSFHSGVLMPEMSVRALKWLLASPRLAARLLFGSLWSGPHALLREVVRRRPMWPSFFSHLNKKLGFISHRRNPRMERVRLA
jgi:hypothetical protein